MSKSEKPEESYKGDATYFASLVAHQLKSPVAAAGSIVKTLLGEYAGSLTPQQKDLLFRADKRIEEALNTSSRMLSLANPDAVEKDNNSITDLSLIVKKIHAIYLEESAINGISFSINIEEEPIYVKASEATLIEILNSLASNALKYTPSNGNIKINLRITPDNKIELYISDSGIGIPPENYEKIFLPFYRSAKNQGSTLPGSGLGLTLVKNLISSIGGTISVCKSEYSGTKFIIKLHKVYKEAATDTKANDISNHSMKVVIIGGIAAGPKVASKIIRLAPTTEVTIIEKSDILSCSGCGLPYYISGVVKQQTDLLSTPVKEVRDPVFFQNIKNIIVLNRTEALTIDRKNKRVKIKNTSNNNKSWINYDKLVLATGSVPKIPNIPGINLKNIFTIHDVHDAESIKSLLAAQKAKDVVIIGGGLIGVESTEALIARGCRVTIIEKQSQILTLFDKEMAKLVEHHMEENCVKILTNTEVKSFQCPDNEESKSDYKISHSQQHKIHVITNNGTIPADMVIIAAGVNPQTKLAIEAGIDIGSTDAIKVNKKMMTSDPNIYAAGDCAQCFGVVDYAECYLPLGSTANKEGRVAAINICGGDEEFPGITGSTACKVFDYCVARTGFSERSAINRGYDIIQTLTVGPDKEHFMPNVKTLMLKLIIDKKTRKILGAQSIGDSDGFNKIDIISTAISAGMTVDQLAGLDLCYAPSYSLAIDNIITAANVAKNKLDGVFAGTTSEEVYNKIINNENFILLDVRSYKEYEKLRIPKSILIPLGVLRSRMHEIPEGKEIITLGSISLRGYEAALILQSFGYNNVKVLDGGITMWPYELVQGIQ
jgi:NADPH-dependent 2,4-dienoyl-CoA reductase/sulfur reductase-like enzyme/rhodanese-related sulfurtransferase/two-component sensor histidine kinase